MFRSFIFKGQGHEWFSLDILKRDNQIVGLETSLYDFVQENEVALIHTSSSTQSLKEPNEGTALTTRLTGAAVVVLIQKHEDDTIFVQTCEFGLLEQLSKAKTIILDAAERCAKRFQQEQASAADTKGNALEDFTDMRQALTPDELDDEQIRLFNVYAALEIQQNPSLVNALKNEAGITAFWSLIAFWHSNFDSFGKRLQEHQKWCVD